MKILNIKQLAKRRIKELRVSEVDCLVTSTNVIVLIFFIIFVYLDGTYITTY